MSIVYGTRFLIYKQNTLVNKALFLTCYSYYLRHLNSLFFRNILKMRSFVIVLLFLVVPLVYSAPSKENLVVFCDSFENNHSRSKAV